MEMTENARILALRLLDRFDEHISAQLLLLRYFKDGNWHPRWHPARGSTGFTGLHGVAFLGMVEIVAAVLGMKEWDVNATDCTGNTALMWAAIKGYEKVVQRLLECEDVDPDQENTRYGQCSEPSGGPTGDGGDNAKRTGRVAQDRTASRSPV